MTVKFKIGAGIAAALFLVSGSWAFAQLGSTPQSIPEVVLEASEPVLQERVKASPAPVALSAVTVVQETTPQVVPIDQKATISPGTQPKATLAPSGAGGIPFTSFVITAGAAPVSLEGVQVKHVGAASNGVFDSIVLVDSEGEETSEEAFFDSERGALLRAEILLAPGESKAFTVLGNMAENLEGFEVQMPQIEVIEVLTDAELEGALPIRGTAQVVNTNLSIGGAMAFLSSYDPGADSTRYIGDKAVRFSAIRLVAKSQEDVLLHSIEWEQFGSAGSGDLLNVKTYVDGAAYPTEADGKLYATTITPPIRIKKGEGVDLWIEGDLGTTGSNRTVQFNLHEEDALAVSGASYGYDVGVEAEYEQGSSFFVGSAVTISPGTISVGKSL